jgi:hypothetical protein
LILNGAASRQIEWHCKHYVGRGLMKRFDSGAALAKEMQLDLKKLKATFDEYNKSVNTKNDPFGKKVKFRALICFYFYLLAFSFSHQENGQ